MHNITAAAAVDRELLKILTLPKLPKSLPKISQSPPNAPKAPRGHAEVRSGSAESLQDGAPPAKLPNMLEEYLQMDVHLGPHAA